jgi:lipopolysaccharide/colanic/teichoic acid biosynthesis glycosyltransferase
MRKRPHSPVTHPRRLESCLLIYANLKEAAHVMAHSFALSRQDLNWQGVFIPEKAAGNVTFNGIQVQAGLDALPELIRLQHEKGFRVVTLVVGESVKSPTDDQLTQMGCGEADSGFHVIKLTSFWRPDDGECTTALPSKPFSYPAKRWLEVGLVILVALFLLPIFGLIALGNFLSAPREPIFFRQWRPGLLGRPFLLCKFRSFMGPSDPPDSLNLKLMPRITIWGRFLRRWRLDELPQLWNVIVGDMALIGPRPLLLRDQPQTHDRLRVRPGLTGWAQINGGQLLSIQEKNALDLFYVRRVSLLFDLKVLALTAWRLFKGDQLHEKSLEQALREQPSRLASEAQPIER